MSKGKKPSKVRAGVCALMGTEGPYAKSHLIPAALTKPETKGEKFIEAGRGMRPVRRPSSWYDNQLLGYQGEALLAELDSDGIKILRKHKLIWSAWPQRTSNFKFDDSSPQHTLPAETSIREVLISLENAARLKLFLLSILWRFLSSRLSFLSYLDNIGIDLDEIAQHIKSNTAPLEGIYRISLYQLTTRGHPHNHTPTIQEMNMDCDKSQSLVRYYRIYFQGLVVYFYARNETAFPDSASLFVGEAEKLVVLGRPFENSRQEMELHNAVAESFQEWPEDSFRVGRSS